MIDIIDPIQFMILKMLYIMLILLLILLLIFSTKPVVVNNDLVYNLVKAYLLNLVSPSKRTSKNAEFENERLRQILAKKTTSPPNLEINNSPPRNRNSNSNRRKNRKNHKTNPSKYAGGTWESPPSPEQLPLPSFITVRS
eukprot:TRINITY_DN634_c0_g1_i2.p1 TRINITY_DN634_c0_g1~~TRINITY_DN634_c0_g1_i2.p1  ORF type:complete len:140 (-),score=25.10 TRINITY_DN634_c0_g1_i2:197-616(-)